MSTPLKPTGPNNRSSPTGTFFTPKPIGLTTTRKNIAKPLGTPGNNAPININGANGEKNIQRQLKFGPNEGGKRKTQRRKHHRKSKKRTTKSRA